VGRRHQGGRTLSVEPLGDNHDGNMWAACCACSRATTARSSALSVEVSTAPMAAAVAVSWSEAEGGVAIFEEFGRRQLAWTLVGSDPRSSRVAAQVGGRAMDPGYG
jgi:hypothetical protein